MNFNKLLILRCFQNADNLKRESALKTNENPSPVNNEGFANSMTGGKK